MLPAFFSLTLSSYIDCTSTRGHVPSVLDTHAQLLQHNTCDCDSATCNNPPPPHEQLAPRGPQRCDVLRQSEWFLPRRWSGASVRSSCRARSSEHITNKHNYCNKTTATVTLPPATNPPPTTTTRTTQHLQITGQRGTHK